MEDPSWHLKVLGATSEGYQMADDRPEDARWEVGADDHCRPNPDAVMLAPEEPAADLATMVPHARYVSTLVEERGVVAAAVQQDALISLKLYSVIKKSVNLNSKMKIT